MRRTSWLLVLVFVILTLGHMVLLAAYPQAWAHFFPGQPWRVLAVPVTTTLAWAVLLVVLWRKGCRETLVVPVVALLAGLGLLFLLRLAGGAYTLDMRNQTVDLFFNSFTKQYLFFFVGMGILLAVQLIRWDITALARYKYLVALATVGMLLVTTIFGKDTGGQTLAIDLKVFSFQPHDLVKVLLVAFMAAYLVEKRELFDYAAARARFLSVNDLRYLAPMVGLWLLVMLIVFMHQDLGAALLLFGILLGMLYLGTGRKTYVGLGLGLFLLGVFGAYKLLPLVSMSGFQRIQTRIAIWLDPWRPEFINDKGYQIVQSLMALGNGRVIGAGLAGGFPENIPAVHTDMIYAAISEDLGLVGAVFVVLLFAVVIQRIFRVAIRAEHRFAQLLTAGLGLTMAIQALVILGGVVKAIPLTGITLPFISYGGTSLVISCLILGLVLKVASIPREG